MFYEKFNVPSKWRLVAIPHQVVTSLPITRKWKWFRGN